MDKTKLGITALAVSAAILLGLNLTTPSPTQAAAIAASRDYQAATSKAQNGGEALYILDNRTGQIAVFLYDTRDKNLRARDVRLVRELFFGR